MQALREPSPIISESKTIFWTTTLSTLPLYFLYLEVIESNEVFYLEPIFEYTHPCGGPDSGKGNKITLEQGEYATREAVMPLDRHGHDYNMRFEACPAGVECTDDLLQRSGKKATYALTFATNAVTRVGTYNIQYLAYSGGRYCGWIVGGCVTIKESVKKRVKFKLKLVACNV